MIHPSYVDLMQVVNKDVEVGETPVINSRYSIVMATAKRARQLVDGQEALIDDTKGKKPLSIAVEELEQEAIRILPQDEEEILKMENADVAAAKALEELADLGIPTERGALASLTAAQELLDEDEDEELYEEEEN